MRIWGWTLLALGAAACGDGVDRDIEDRLGIGSGVYGQALSTSDVGDEGPRYLVGAELEARLDDTIVGSARTDDHGFYQIELDPRVAFSICSATGHCLDLDLPPGPQYVRVDYAGGVDTLTLVRTWSPED